MWVLNTHQFFDGPEEEQSEMESSAGGANCNIRAGKIIILSSFFKYVHNYDNIHNYTNIHTQLQFIFIKYLLRYFKISKHLFNISSKLLNNH